MTDLPHAFDNEPVYEGYVLDAENAAEIARLMLLDHLLTQIMGGSLPEQTDLSQVSRVLDIGCGPGGWLFDVVTQYPHLHGVGIDISQLMVEYATSLAPSQGLGRISFQVMDATRPLGFPDQAFDLVNGRILSGFLSTHQWPALLQECARISRPGGIVRLTEAEWAFTNSAALDQLTTLGNLAAHQSGHTFSPHGRTIGTTPMLRWLLQQAGYEVLGQRAHVVDYSAGTQAHESNTQLFLVFYKLYQPFLVQMQVATQEELDILYRQMEEEMQAPDFCAVDYYLTVWGRKLEKSA